jgi:hypothetical protein
LSTCTATTRLLTNNAPSTQDCGPAWTHDGRGIVFLEFADGQQPDLWMINADGTHRRRVTNTPEIEISPTSGPSAPGSSAPACGDITATTTLRSDRRNCAHDGLQIGADGNTLNLNGHTIDGDAVSGGN